VFQVFNEHVFWSFYHWIIWRNIARNFRIITKIFLEHFFSLIIINYQVFYLFQSEIYICIPWILIFIFGIINDFILYFVKFGLRYDFENFILEILLPDNSSNQTTWVIGKMNCLNVLLIIVIITITIFWNCVAIKIWILNLLFCSQIFLCIQIFLISFFPKSIILSFFNFDEFYK